MLSACIQRKALKGLCNGTITFYRATGVYTYLHACNIKTRMQLSAICFKLLLIYSFIKYIHFNLHADFVHNFDYTSYPGPDLCTLGCSLFL